MNEQILETIKSLNIAFDGKLNSQTLEIVMAQIIPYLYFIQIKGLIVDIMWCIAIVVSAIFVTRFGQKKGKEQL